MIGKGVTKTRVVVAYQPCEKRLNRKGFTVFEQHERYFEPRGDFRSPRTIFLEQLVSQLLLWKASGEEIILFGDFNEHVYTCRLAKRLEDGDLLMQEQYRAYTGKQLPATFLRGPRPIDGVFATTGVTVRNAGLLRRRGGVGDHRCFILDFESLSVFGNTFPQVLPPNTRKLNCEFLAQ